jgi:hypothetical protein
MTVALVKAVSESIAIVVMGHKVQQTKHEDEYIELNTGS